MRSRLIFTLTILLLAFQVSALEFHAPLPSLPPDSVPPPPGGPIVLTGPSYVCIGDTTTFLVEVPVSCSCQWYINDILQPQTTPTLVVNWATAGTFEVSVVFQCSGGQFSDPQTILVDVLDTPQPSPISGDTYVCEFTNHTYSTVVGPLDSCQWSVNGNPQPGYGPSINFAFGEAGTYIFEVIAYNPCGTSAPQTLAVTAQGTAPSTPTPVQGSEESCESDTEIYLTTVEPGEYCSWWVDGELQAETGPTIEVAWNESGDHMIEVRAVSDCGTGNPAYKYVMVLYQPDVFLGNDTTIMQGQSLVLDAGNVGSEYFWSTLETTQTITVNVAGIYVVDVFNYCGIDSDTINVSVYTGLKESVEPDKCFSYILNSNSIDFSFLPANALKMQVFGISGQFLYDGVPAKRIALPADGIYIIRIITPESSCIRKVIIP